MAGQKRRVQKLTDVLSTTEYRKRFSEFCEQSFASENLHFYDAIEQYETFPTMTARSRFAKQIVQKYVVEGSPDQVNLPSELREQIIKQSSSTSGCTPSLFKAAKEEVFDLMNKNFFDRFMQSEKALEGLSAFPGESNDVEANKRIVSTYFARHSDKDAGMDRLLAQARSSGRLGRVRQSTLKSLSESEPVKEQQSSSSSSGPSSKKKPSSSKGSKKLKPMCLVVLKGSIPNRESELRDFLESFYGIYAQEKLGEVKNLAKHFVGKGDQLTSRLEKKYGVTFIPHDDTADETMCRVLFEQLWHFYSKHDQTKLDRNKLVAIVNWSISHSVGALNEMLKSKYGEDLNISITLCV